VIVPVTCWPSETTLTLALQFDDAGALDAAASVGDAGAVDAEDAVDAAADGSGACDVGAVCTAVGEATDEPATAGCALALGVVGAAAFDDERGLHAVTPATAA
jgi:hypothetical protein